MKTVNYLLLGLCIAMAACKPDEPEMPEPEVPKDEIISGTCGDNLTWTFTTADSTLTISGTGNMYDYNYSSDQPWYNFNQGIKNISIQDGVTSIGNGAFYNCSALTQMDIPNSVTSIGDHAFSNCSALTQVNIPDGVTSIGEDAFNNCEALTQVTIPSSVTSIGKRAFAYCFALTAINVESGNTAYCSENGILFNKDKTTLVCYPAGKPETTYAIPESVTSIGDYAFYACSTLTQVTIPSSVASIGNYAFYNCYSITQVTWNAINCADFKSSDYIPFYDIRSNITNFIFGEQVEHIPACLCYGMDKLTEVTIPSSITSIGSGTFYECSALTAVYYTGDVAGWCGITFDYYYSNPLYYAHNLYIDNTLVTRLNIPDGINEIKDYTFLGCNTLRQATIPDGVTSIGSSAFQFCSALTQVTIGNSVTSIGNGAFYECSALAEMTVLATVPPTIGEASTFYNVSRNIPVYVPAESLKDYQAAVVWKEFTNLHAMPTGLQTPSMPESIRVYGGLLHNPQQLPVSLYDMQGRMVYSGTAATVSQPAGVYVLRCAGASSKVLF